MTLENLLINHSELINDETFIYICDENTSSLLASGNWYQDNIIDYTNNGISGFTWQDNNELYIILRKGNRIMTIKGARTIAEYKDMQKTRIQKWVNDRFITGSITWEMSGSSNIKITDKTGDSIIISLDEIE